MVFDVRFHLFANNAYGQLKDPISNSQVSLELSAQDGDRFPDPAPGEIFKLSLYDVTNGEVEILHCTSRTGNVLTVERGQENTTAREWNTGTPVQHTLTAGTLEWVQSFL